MRLLFIPHSINIDETVHSFFCRDVLPPLFCLSSATSPRLIILRDAFLPRAIQGHVVHHVGLSVRRQRLSLLGDGATNTFTRVVAC